MTGKDLLSPRIWVFPLVAFVTALLTAGTPAPRSHAAQPVPDLARLTPMSFGQWQALDIDHAIRPVEETSEEGTEVLYRSYRGARGQVVTLVIAYGGSRGDTLRLHRPEVCYRAQGFAIRGRQKVTLAGVPVIELQARSLMREETVTYWLRNGEQLTDGELDQQLSALTRLLSAPADGVLVRLSSVGVPSPQTDADHADFLRAFLMSLSPEARELMLPRALIANIDTSASS